MSIETLAIIKKRRILEDTNLNIQVAIDTVVRENWRNTNTVTRFPVEFNTNISDHVIRQPSSYTFTGVISDSLLSNIRIGEIINPDFEVFGSSTEEKQTRSTAAWVNLMKIFEGRNRITLQTGLITLENFIITSLTANKDKSTANALFFEMTCQEVIVVNTDTIQRSRDNLTGDTVEQASDKVEEGKRDKKNLTDQEDKSFLAKGADWLTNIVRGNN